MMTAEQIVEYIRGEIALLEIRRNRVQARGLQTLHFELSAEIAALQAVLQHIVTEGR